MERRTFIKNTALTAGLAASSTFVKAENSRREGGSNAAPFKLKYAPHFGMFKNNAGEDHIDQIKFMADQGFRAMEDNGMRNRDEALQKKIGETMAELGMEMGVFVAHTIHWKEPSLTTGKKDSREAFLNDIRSSIEVAKRCNAKWMTVVPGHLDLRQDMGYQTTNVVETLKQASGLLEPFGLVMVLEPLNFYNHPGLFLTKAAQGFQVCKAVNSPSCKILFDIYHQQIQEGNLLPNIEKCWDEIGYFQIGDNPGRKEPTTGEINYKNVFKYIHEREWDGIMGMEHGNSKKGAEGEMAVIKAYREVDNF